MMHRDPKKMASSVLERAFGKNSYARGGEVGNYSAPKKKSQGSYGMNGGAGDDSNFPMERESFQQPEDMFGNPGSDSNFADPDEDVQSYAEGGEVDEGKVMAAEEILSALESKDAKALAKALTSLVEQCYEAEESEPMENEG